VDSIHLGHGNALAFCPVSATAAAVVVGTSVTQSQRPSVGWCLPAGHAVHVTEPSTSPKVFSGQSLQVARKDPANDMYFPAAHVLHSVEPFVCPVLPGGQSTHVLAPTVTENLPLLQDTHESAPSVAVKLPAGQSTHAPLSGLAFPAAHELQPMLPTALVFVCWPAPHS